MRALYEIQADIEKVIEDFVDVETGEVLDGFEDAMNALSEEKAAKIEQVGLLIKNLKAESEMVAAEVERLTKRKRSCEKRIDSIKNFLTFWMNGEKVKTARVNMYTMTSKSVDVLSEDLIPEQFMIQQAPTVNKVELKKVLMTGAEVPGAVLKEKQSLVVR